MARPEPFLKYFGAEISSRKVEQKFHCWKTKQFCQSHGTAVREVVGEHTDSVINLKQDRLQA